MNLIRTLTVLTAILIGVYAECRSTPKCSCKMNGDAVEVEENIVSTEVLAGAVGALSSIVVSGGGISVWYMLKSRGTSVADSDSLSSEEVDTERKRPPPPYNKDSARGDEGVQETAFRTPNIYSASRNDNLSHRIAAQGNSMNY